MASEFMTQTEELKAYLETHEGITQFEALRNLGIMRLASRVADLRKMGVPVMREMVSVKARNGRKASVARYSLAKEE